MASLHFESVFALSHSLFSHLASSLESREDKTDNIFMMWNQNCPQQKPSFGWTILQITMPESLPKQQLS
jgi:hypothetical protein